MKSLNKLFSSGLVALALTFGAYASNDGQQQEEVVDAAPSTKLKQSFGLCATAANNVNSGLGCGILWMVYGF